MQPFTVLIGTAAPLSMFLGTATWPTNPMA